MEKKLEQIEEKGKDDFGNLVIELRTISCLKEIISGKFFAINELVVKVENSLKKKICSHLRLRESRNISKISKSKRILYRNCPNMKNLP